MLIQPKDYDFTKASDMQILLMMDKSPEARAEWERRQAAKQQSRRTEDTTPRP